MHFLYLNYSKILPLTSNVLILEKLRHQRSNLRSADNTICTRQDPFFYGKKTKRCWNIILCLFFLCTFSAVGFQQVAVTLGNFAWGISAGLQSRSCCPLRLGLSFSERKLMQEIVSNGLLSPGLGRKELIPDLQRGRGLGTHPQKEPEPWRCLAVKKQQSLYTFKDGEMEWVLLEGSSQTLGTSEDTIIAEIVFPIMLEPWGGERQNSQFTENKVTLCTYFILLAKRHLFILQ